MTMIVLVAILLFTILPSDTAKRACILFIGAESVLCYSVAGLSKLSSPAWRNGTALIGIVSTRTYGDRRLFQRIQGHPLLARASALAVIAFECSVAPLVCAGIAGAVVFGFGGFLFHLGSAVFMRFYRFFWAMLATYPALFYLSDRTALWLSQHGVDTWKAVTAAVVVVTALGAVVITAGLPRDHKLAGAAKVGGNDA